MQFKHPEILYFLFLLIIPILVHLFQLRRFKKEYFTNVRFLKEIAMQTRKSSSIKKLLLLATRLLLLACIIFAFAQPFFESKNHKDVSNEMYIVLDNSFSMQAKGKNGALMKRAVQELLEHTPENVHFSLLTNSETFWNTDIKSVQKELQNLNYSPTPFELESAMAKIKARKSAYNKDVIVITDAMSLQSKQLKSIDPNFNTYFIIPKAEQKNNVAVDSVYINQTLDNFYEITVKIKRYGTENKTIPIALYNQQKLIAKTIISVDSNEKKCNFTIPKEDFHGYVSIQDSGLEYDNDYYFSISKPEKTKVISIGQADKSKFMSRIYTEDEFVYSNSELSSLDYNSIEKQDAVVLNELNSIPQALENTLKSFVNKGGNLIFIPSENAESTATNTFLKPFGGIQMSAMIKKDKKITKIHFEHPLFTGVFEKKTDNFQYPNASISANVKSFFPPVLSFEDQQPFLFSVPNPLSSVYVFTAALNKNNSNFQNSPIIVPTFYKMAQNSQKIGVNAITIGENQQFIADVLLGKDEILSVQNEAEKFIPVQQILNGKVKMTFQDYPQKAGNFGLFSKDKLIRNLSFNYNRSESNLFQNNENLLSDYKTMETIESVFNSIQIDRTDNQFWKIFIFLTLFFIIAEMLIQKFLK